MAGFLKDLIDKVHDKHGDRGHPPPLPHNKPATPSSLPPPIPGSKPGQHQVPLTLNSNQRAYWQPGLSPAIPLSTFFGHETGSHGWGNNEAQNYVAVPGNSFFADNALHIRAIAQHAHPDAAQRYTSARLTSHQTLQRDRGVLSARITAPIAKGIWPALWLLPAEPFSWPTDGEIDMFEAWDGSSINHSCLHWGHFNGPDHDKHRVVETELGHKILGRQPGQGYGEGVLFELVWWESEDGREGRVVWYIDGRPVMKAAKPVGTRPLKHYRILINVAMGGNVCQGRLPDDGTYEMVIRDLAMWEEVAGGWDRFERDYNQTREGHTS